MSERKADVAKYLFGVINLPPLCRELVCGPFTISSRRVSDDVMDASGDTSEGPGQLLTADGEYTIPLTLPSDGAEYYRFADEAYREFSRRAEIVDLLLCFAHRRHVQIWNPYIYVGDGDKRRYKGGGSFYPDWGGPRRGVPWYLGEEDLHHFMHSAYARMVDEFDEVRGGEQRKGLRLALLTLNGAREQTFSEIRFLRTWSALEILVNSSRDVKEFAVSGSQFKGKYRPALEAKIGEIAAEATIAADMKAKLLELNRRGIVARIKDLVAIVLPADKYPQHQIEEGELTEFRNIRDDITHTGRLQAKRIDGKLQEYGDYLNLQESLLMEFVETVILAMLGWNGDPMDVSWRHFRDR